MSTPCPLDARVYPTVHTESAHRVLVSSTESPDAAAGALYGGRLPVCHLSVFPSFQRVPSRDTHPRKNRRRLETGVDKIDSPSGQAADIARQNPRPSVPYTLPPRCQGPGFTGPFLSRDPSLRYFFAKPARLAFAARTAPTRAPPARKAANPAPAYRTPQQQPRHGILHPAHVSPRPFRPPRADCALNVRLWLALTVQGAAPVSALANEDAKPSAGVAPCGAFLLLNTVYPPYSVALGDGGGRDCPSSTPLERKQFRQVAHRAHGPVTEQRHGGRSLSAQSARPGCRRGRGGPARAQLPAAHGLFPQLTAGRPPARNQPGIATDARRRPPAAHPFSGVS